MEIIKKTLDGQTFNLFKLQICGKEQIVAEENLDKYIENCFNYGIYDNEVKEVDLMYDFCVPQKIAKTMNEEEIRKSVEYIYKKYF